ncbi:PAS domain-containing protein [Gracilimonas mengyeensis]|uniref:PAS domain S-box-containing protein n=1 Tax=Gracilimonas mengyeensis TaxID=1302730 RepID=A0A521CCR2_9BACT|nr:PAS domain-containing protein [Gracilimonas mengyeensis]SMO57229.1 PAS domain S-box-containing protein [Gracilimonas mengyeensis]
MEQNLDSKLLDQLKQCSKDEASYSKLEELVGELYQRFNNVKKQLSLLEQAIKHDYDSILITDLNLEKPGPKIVYVNEGFTRMTGYTKEEAIGNTPRMLQGEKTDRHVLDRLKKRLIEGQAFFGHTVNYRKDGSEFINQWDIHPLTNKKGEITHWVSYQRDITERKESSKLVFDSNLDFDNLVEESKKTYIDLDVQGNIISSNNSFKSLMGYDADELKTVKIWDLVTDEHKPELKDLFEDFDSKNIEDHPYKWDFIQKDDEIVELEADISYFVSNEETIIRIHFDNLTLRNRIIETLKKKKQNFNEIVGKKDEFTLRFVVDEEGRAGCKFVSDNFTNITGLNPDIVLDKDLAEVIHSDNLEEVEKALEKAFNGETSSVNCKYKTSEGEYISVIQSFKPDLAADNETVKSVKSVAMIEMEVED